MDRIIEQLIEFLVYDPDTGDFLWRKPPGKNIKSGEIAGTVGRKGYRVIGFGGRYYAAHRIAWLYVHGDWPSADLDHINGSKADNRIANLRIATKSQNQANSHLRKDNTSGLKGVHWDKKNEKWVAQISLCGHIRNLGRFFTKDAAHSAYCLAAKQYFGEFSKTGV